MSLDIKEYNEKVKSLLASVESEFPIVNARLSRSALSMIRNRIINKGVDHRGKPFGKYSQNPLPFFFFHDKAISGGADKKLEAYKKKHPEGISYEEFRRINGLQTKFKDFKFTGETLRDIDVLETRVVGGVVTTVVASKNSITKKSGKGTVTTGKVADYLAEQYGDFLTLSEEETSALEQALDDELQIFLDKHFTQ